MEDGGRPRAGGCADPDARRRPRLKFNIQFLPRRHEDTKKRKDTMKKISAAPGNFQPKAVCLPRCLASGILRPGFSFDIAILRVFVPSW
jgi:hypothetical protein